MNNKNMRSYVLDTNNVDSLYNGNEFIREFLTSKPAAHKIIIHNCSDVSVRTVIKTLTTQVQPHLIVPVDIKQNSEQDIEFKCKNCAGAIDKLCAKDCLYLTLGHRKLRMTIVIGYAVDLGVRKVILSCFMSRFDISIQSLNLGEFEEMQGLYKDFYCDITFPPALSMLIKHVKFLRPKITHLKLAQNKIESLNGFKSNIIGSIDLTSNKIHNLNDLSSLSGSNIKDINLSENPICGEFEYKIDYILAIKSILPEVETIDGKPIDLLAPENNFRHFGTSRPAEYLVDQFLEHYFALFDNLTKRNLLQNLYHPNAIFSLTATFENEFLKLSTASQKFYTLAHNILNRNFTCFELMQTLCYLPEVEHDPYSFCVDILHFVENKSVLFAINGTFREISSNPVLYFFNRAFFLLAVGNGEYKITNDLFHVTNSLPETLKQTAFSMQRYKGHEEVDLPIARNCRQKQAVLRVLMECTTLQKHVAKKLLEKTEWNVRKALQKFIYSYRFDQITPNSFLRLTLNNNKPMNSEKEKPTPKIKPNISTRKMEVTNEQRNKYKKI